MDPSWGLWHCEHEAEGLSKKMFGKGMKFDIEKNWRSGCISYVGDEPECNEELLRETDRRV